MDWTPILNRPLVYGHYMPKAVNGYEPGRRVTLDTLGRFILSPGGTVTGYARDTEMRWEIRGQQLAILRKSKFVSTSFYGRCKVGETLLYIGRHFDGRKEMFLTPLVTLPQASVAWKYLVASHVKYGAPLEATLTRMKALGIPPARVWVVVAASEKPEVRIMDGITFFHVKENAYEYTALMEMARRADITTTKWFYLLHDTVDLGDKFPQLTESQWYVPDMDFLSITRAGQFNMGFFSLAFLRKHRAFLQSLDGVSKLRGIDIELNRHGLGFKNMASVTGNFLDGDRTIMGESGRFSDVKRICAYLPGADIKKWYQHVDPRVGRHAHKP